MAIRQLFIFLFLNFLKISFCDQQSTYETSMDAVIPHHGRCEPIKIPFCKDIEYNMTIMPNLIGHTKQEDAGLEVHQFIPLVKIKCSPDLHFFLCSLYAPVCTILDRPLPPCRSLCESARTCEIVMRTYDFHWPENLECSKFPEFGGSELCVAENTTNSTPNPIKPHTPRIINAYNKDKSNPPGGPYRNIGFVCPEQLKTTVGIGYALKINGRETKDCGAPCHSLFFPESERTVLRYLVGSWAAVCCASCLFTFLTFLIDPSRFRYPERPIVFLAICYLVVGIVYVAGLGAGDSVACREPFPPRYAKGKLQMLSTITMGHGQTSYCTILFMALYFCCMSAFAWWSCLALAWFLAAGLKWGHEAIENKSHYFHIFAWVLPAVQTISALAMGKVEGDVLSGVCFIGQLDSQSLGVFLLAPLCIYLGIGALFILAGFISLFRIRTVMKHDGTRTDKLERLMVRIGLFSCLFILPALGLLSCLFYEYYNLDDWMTQWHRDLCKKFSIPCPIPKSDPNEEDRPYFYVYVVKYFCSMLVGVTLSLWLWSGKTVLSWQRFAARLQGKDVRARGTAYV